MAKKGKGAIQISRKGMLIWATLILFICCWMFILGILVGRGQAPVDLSAGMLEDELKDLKAANAQKEQAKVEARAKGNGGEKPELGFYKALKEGQGRQPMKMPPKKPVKPDPAPALSKPVAPKKPAATPKKAKPPSPKPTAKPAPAAKPTPSKGRFTIQVAAVKAIASAEKLVADLRKKGYPAYQVRVTVPGKGPWYRVRVGAYDNRNEAAQMLKKLSAGKVTGMVVNTK